MSDEPLDLERSAFLVKLKQEIERLEKRVENLEEEQNDAEPLLSDDFRSVIEQNAKIVDVTFDGPNNARTIFDLSDDRVVSVPTSWSWRLENASREELKNYEIVDEGSRVVWPEVEEAITVHGILAGDPVPQSENE